MLQIISASQSGINIDGTCGSLASRLSLIEFKLDALLASTQQVAFHYQNINVDIGISGDELDRAVRTIQRAWRTRLSKFLTLENLANNVSRSMPNLVHQNSPRVSDSGGEYAGDPCANSCETLVAPSDICNAGKGDRLDIIDFTNEQAEAVQRRVWRKMRNGENDRMDGRREGLAKNSRIEHADIESARIDKPLRMSNESKVESWPSASELWKFNGRISGVPVFDDSNGTNRVDGLGCRGGSTNKYFREVRILETRDDCQYVRVKGIGNLEWLEGCIDFLDEEGMLIADKFSEAAG